VPLVDGAVSTNDVALAPPSGLLDALGDQLDLAEVYSPPNFILYENRAWVPVRSVLTTAGEESSLAAGSAALAQADLAGATPIMTDDDHLGAATADVPAGTVHLGIPVDRRWQLELADGSEVDSRPAFGTTMAFDVDAPGSVTLRYQTSQGFRLLLVAQLLLWVTVVVAASSIRFTRPRLRPRTVGGRVEEPMFTMFDPMIDGPAVGAAGVADAADTGHDDSTGALAAVFDTSETPDPRDGAVPS